MLMPSSWHDENGAAGMRANEFGTNIAGCTSRLRGVDVPRDYGPCVAHWFTNGTTIPGEPTLREALRTYMDYEFVKGIKTDWTRKHPWRAPGTARVDSPCGVLGGNPEGCPRGNPSHDGCPSGSWGRGPDARSVKFPKVVTTEWVRGSVVEAAWGISANHGGGYSYRLCRRPKRGGNMLLEEDCFRRGVLDFVGDRQWVQFGTDESTRFEFKAERTSEGTSPKGSTWTKNPIPAWNCPSGGFLAHKFDGIPGGDMGCTAPQFPPPRKDLFGFGHHARDPTKQPFNWGIVDKLQVPQDLPTGEYVLSWRWDAEQTPQVWTTCANVRIVEEGSGGQAADEEADEEDHCRICSDGEDLQGGRRAGVHEGRPYSCRDAENWLHSPAGRPFCRSLVPNYRSICCSTADAVSHSCSLCPHSRLMAERIAGYHGWHPYTCKEAQDFLHSAEGKARCTELVAYWDFACCDGSGGLVQHRRLKLDPGVFV